MMGKKHAYLIMAHADFAVLERLIGALDDARNDIYLHVDRKVSQMPLFQTRHANIIVLDNRIDVRWGHSSQIDTELKLFKTASDSYTYAYYHLLSGADMPLKSQNYIHNFFSRHAGKEFIGFYPDEAAMEIERKVRRYHILSRYFRINNNWLKGPLRLARFVAIRLQDVLGIRRNRNIVFKKGGNWVSITHPFVMHLLSQKKWIERTFKYSFCGDELYKHTICWNSAFKSAIFSLDTEEGGNLRKINWQRGHILTWKQSDLKQLFASESLFARKFEGDDLSAVDSLLNYLKDHKVYS